MVDVYIQEWDGSVQHKDMYLNYRLFKPVFGCERYLDFVDVKRFRDSLVKLRLGVLPIGASHFRKTFHKDLNTLCKLCHVLEDEDHFVFHCPLYSTERKKYIDVRYYSYVNVLRNGSIPDIRRLSTFLFLAMKIRLDFVENTDGI